MRSFTFLLPKRQAFPPKSPKYSNAGFTLLEVIVVVLMIGILAAIAGPSWLAFLNRQRVSKVNDAILSALQDAQSKAKKTKANYSASFRTQSNSVEVTVYPDDGTIDPNDPNDLGDSAWSSLGEGLEIRPGQVALLTNLDDNNEAKETELKPVTNARTITFDNFGNLNNEEQGQAIIAVSIPKSDNPSTYPNDYNQGTTRCIEIVTILGGMRSVREEECEP